jgi:hypothetical protein
VAAAVISLQKALELNREEYCPMAKEDHDFDTIREEETFKALMQEFCNNNKNNI